MPQSKRKFHKTVLRVTVLSEEPYEFTSLSQTASDIDDGPCSGEVEVVSTKILSALQAAHALEKQASDPGFFNLTEKGEDATDDEPEVLEPEEEEGDEHETQTPDA
jgi:hypothetical protein